MDMSDPAQSGPPPEPRRDRPPVWEAAGVVVAGLLVLGAVAYWAGSSPRGSARLPTAEAEAGGRPSDGPYIGSRACRDCHPGEYALFTRSGHSRTLAPASRRPLARELAGRKVADPEWPGIAWTYALDGEQLRVERAGEGKGREFAIDYAFGSGHHAMTFLTLIDRNPREPIALEHRLTYFTAKHALGITPGQKDGRIHGQRPWGYEMTPRETFKCFGCHTTRTSAAGDSTLDAATMIPNVSCERCHGPGRAHVEAARRGEADLTMPMGLGGWTAEGLLAFCGRCHRDPAKAPPNLVRPDNRMLARFQPVGLSQSRCFKESQGAITCINCHDPHARARSDRGSYEAACLGCHATAPQATCPTSPRGGCIDCHMPRVDSGQGILFTDHWIRVRDEPGRRPSVTAP
jgi:hypothetical protein